MDVCREEVPPLREVAPGHFVASATCTREPGIREPRDADA